MVNENRWATSSLEWRRTGTCLISDYTKIPENQISTKCGVVDREKLRNAWAGEPRRGRTGAACE